MKFHFTLLLVATGITALAQTNNYPTTGNVGLGTGATPAGAKLEIKNPGNHLKLSGGTIDGGVWTDGLSVLYLADWNTATKGLNINMSTGNIGIGTSSPLSKLSIRDGDIRMSATTAGTRLLIFDAVSTQNISNFISWRRDDNARWMLGSASNGGVDDFAIFRYSNTGSILGAPIEIQRSSGSVFFQEGNVGIGTKDTKGYKLAVYGKAIAEEIVVKLQGNWPDYVFETNYNLPTLAELEAFIKLNKHLPEVPAACVVEENGVELGKMNMLLLKKVEELTLYMIEQQKIIEDQNRRLLKLETK